MMGCQNPCIRVWERNFRAVGRVFYTQMKNLLTNLVRRAANILNKHTIRMIVLNLLTTVLYGGFVLRANGMGMTKSILFLSGIFLICDAHAAYLMDLAHSGATCPFGYYHLDGKCISLSTQDARCPKINGAQQTYRVQTEASTFRGKEAANLPCWGTYSLYSYDTSLLVKIPSRGTFYKVSSYAPTCPFGSYHFNGECITYASGQKNCKENHYKTVAESASFMALEQVEPVCLGTYSRYKYTESTDDMIYPRYNGTLMYIGSEIGTFKTMKETKCSKNSEHYYRVELRGVASDYQPFARPERAICDTSGGYKKFKVNTDCKDITASDIDYMENSETWNPVTFEKLMVCGVLCENAGEVYTNSGRCSTEGYCENGAKKLRLHVALPGANGKKYSYPLYASKTSDPAMHFKFVNASGAEQMCYVNLVPPEAINHFVGTKPNPIRTMFYNPDTGENETLITID